MQFLYCIFLLPGALARGNDLLNRFTTIPLDLLSLLFGTRESSLGGFVLPLDSRLLALVSASSNYYFHERSEAVPLRDSAWCRSFYATRPRWQQRYDQLLSNANGTAVFDSSIWISLIDAPEELERMTEQQMECLLGIGRVPPRLPLGQVYGRVLSVLGSSLIRDLSEAVWGGKLIVKTTCDDGHDLFISCNQVGYGTGAFAHLSIGTGAGDAIPLSYPPERIDDDEYVYINYGRNFTEACEPRIPRHYMSTTAPLLRPAWRSWLPSLIPFRLTGAPGVGLTAPARLTAGIFDNPWPVNQIVDLCRWIGRDGEANLDIYLCKSTLTFPEGLRPVLWFNLKAGDLMEVAVMDPRA